MRLFPVGPTFEGHPHVFSHKRSSPLDFIFDTWASAFSSHLFGWWSWTYVVVDFSTTNVCSAKNHVFCIVGARWHKIIEFVPSCPIYGWLAWWCDFFPVGPTFEDHAHVFRQKKVQPLGFYFWHLRLGLFKSPFWLVKLNMWYQPFARTNVFSAKIMCFAFWARVQDKCAPLQGQMYLWNLFLMSNLRTFSIIIIIAPLPQI